MRIPVTNAPLNLYQLCLLHSRAERTFRSIVSHELQRFHLSMMEWLLLGALRESSEDGMRPSELAKALDVSQPQITVLMHKAAKHGLIHQKTIKSDRRSRLVQLAARGELVMDEIEENSQTYLDKWLKQLPVEQLEIYYETLRHIGEHNFTPRKE